MVSKSFTQELRADNGAAWQALLEHPFICAIGDGTLSEERYRFYLQQDYGYLLDLSRVLALSAAKQPDLSGMRRFAGLLQDTLSEEIEAIEQSWGALGGRAERLASASPGLVTGAYADFLVRTCYEGSLADIVAALLPCETGYVEIAEDLRARGARPASSHCRAWLEAYGSEQMRRLAEQFTAEMDRVAQDATATDRHRWQRLYRKSLQLERLFFQAAWDRDSWPRSVPR